MLFLFRSYMYIMIAAAIIPAIFLIKYIYKVDRLDKEPRSLIIRLVLLGVVSTWIAVVLENIGIGILQNSVSEYDPKFAAIEFFLIVGPAEEISKYVLLRFGSWKRPEFNCQFDAIVYAVSVSLGFALWENIKYVFSYGFSVALVRAVTAVPGHACFGVFMGIWYGVAKRQEVIGNTKASAIFRWISVICPAIIHGAYDYIATCSDTKGELIFVVFIIAMFLICFKAVQRLSKNDRYLDSNKHDDDDNHTVIIDV